MISTTDKKSYIEKNEGHGIKKKLTDSNEGYLAWVNELEFSSFRNFPSSIDSTILLKSKMNSCVHFALALTNEGGSGIGVSFSILATWKESALDI